MEVLTLAYRGCMRAINTLRSARVELFQRLGMRIEGGDRATGYIGSMDEGVDGSTTTDCWRPSATSRLPRLKQTTTGLAQSYSTVRNRTPLFAYSTLA